MLTIVPRLRLILLCALALLLVPLAAWADDGGQIPSNLGVWPAVSFTACSLALWALRRFSGSGFLHTPTGAVLGALVAGVINAIQPVISAHGIDGRAILFAALGALGAGLAMSNPSGTPAAKMVKPPIASIIALVMIPLALSACLPPLSACKVPAPVDVAKCQLEKDLIACGEQTGMDLLPIVLDLIMHAIGTPFDPAAIVSQLEAEGFKDIPCILAALENYLLPVSPPKAGLVHQVLVYKLKRDGKRGDVSIKLRSGKIVQAVVQ